MTQKTEDMLYRFWWLHDGAWYQNVAKRFGFEIANELNKESLRYMAQRVMQAYLRENHVDTNFATLEDLVKPFMEGSLKMWADGWCETSAEILGPSTFEVVLSKNFAIDWIRRAGTLQQYACPGLVLREGWFAGLGVKDFKQEETTCMVKGDDACRFTAHITLQNQGDDAHA